MTRLAGVFDHFYVLPLTLPPNAMLNYHQYVEVYRDYQGCMIKSDIFHIQ